MNKFGRFSGEPLTVWISSPGGEDRDMELREDFWYEDPAGVRWLAPSGSTINGASIPRALWTLVGSPYTGKYRRASIVHDVACGSKEQPHRAVHRMFYHACRADGLDDLTAKTMYWAVREFGPRWRTRAELAAGLPLPAAAGAPPPDAAVMAAQVAAIRQELAAQGEGVTID
jgi:hypothetical protein